VDRLPGDQGPGVSDKAAEIQRGFVSDGGIGRRRLQAEHAHETRDRDRCPRKVSLCLSGDDTKKGGNLSAPPYFP